MLESNYLNLPQMSGVEKMNNILIWIGTLTTRCFLLRVNVGSHTIVYILKRSVPLMQNHKAASKYSFTEFYFLELATNFYQQLSYLFGETFPLA
jgi:hypothetical protein